jgi:transcriptional regulator with XRE-family HTH domain
MNAATIKLSLGSSVRSTRQSQKLTQLCLATRLGISTTYLSDIELGNRAPVCDRLLGKIAKELGLELDYLYYLAGLFPPEERGRYTQEEFMIKMASFRG